jgi:hypothetical protein
MTIPFGGFDGGGHGGLDLLEKTKYFSIISIKQKLKSAARNLCRAYFLTSPNSLDGRLRIQGFFS